MIPALGAGGPGFKSRLSPSQFLFQTFKFSLRKKEKILLGDTRIWTRDLPDCSRVLYHWAISPNDILLHRQKVLNREWSTKIVVVRKGIRTPALIRGPEFSFLLPIRRQGFHLESGALDHSAILTRHKRRVLNFTRAEGWKWQNSIYIPSGERTQDLWIRSPTRYPLR